jgi:serine/threonine-protein kinase
VLRAVRDRTLGGTDRTALDDLPHGLRAYYAHLEGQLGVVHGAAPERQLKILAVLATWPEPLAVPRLAELSGERQDTTRAVLRRWAGFLNRLEHAGETRYALYHASFRDFLAERLDIADVRSQMSRAIDDAMP